MLAAGVGGGLTHAAHPRGVELKVGGALAQVASGHVHADPVDAEGRVCTLVHVWWTNTCLFGKRPPLA